MHDANEAESFFAVLQQNGILVLDKPGGMSSAQAISRLKRLGQKKIGHAGTLDPMATGVLIVLLGQATKLSGYILEGGEKTYSGVLRLGTVTDTWDAEGTVVEENDWSSVTESDVRSLVGEWQGESEQVVPPYSAAKHNGTPMYALARAGREVPVKTKKIFVSRAEVQWVDLPDVRFRVTCSSGSYVRSLAHSLGMRAGCGAVLTELTREYSHPYSLADACRLDEILADPESLAGRILPLESALPGWPVITVDGAESALLRNGGPIACRSSMPEGTRAILRGEAGCLALAQVRDGSWAVLRGLFNTP